jgi:hypothetical protein
MKYLSAAASEVNALIDLLTVCQTNNDLVLEEVVQNSYRSIAKIYANNSRRTPMASKAKLDELFAVLNEKVLACNIKAAESRADQLAKQYAASVRTAMDVIKVQNGDAEDEGTELA